jgi:segregation and condensation protein B
MSNEAPRPRKKAPPRVQPAGAASVRDLVAALGDLGQPDGEDTAAVAEAAPSIAVERAASGDPNAPPGAAADTPQGAQAGALSKPRRSRRTSVGDAASAEQLPDASGRDAGGDESGPRDDVDLATDGGEDASSAGGDAPTQPAEVPSAEEAGEGTEGGRSPRPGVQLVDALPMDDDDDLSQIEGEASARLTMIVESLLFASSKPLSVKELRRVLGDPSTRQIQLALRKLIDDSQGRGVVCQQVAGGFVLRTHPDNAAWVQKLLQAKPVRLSRPQLETLAVAAYRQPITRPEIDLVRGVDSGATLKVLLERELVQIVGRKEEPGRPLLYGTTVKFLEFFNLTSLRDLPDLREFKELSSEAKAQLRRDMSEDEIEVLGQEVMAFAHPEDGEAEDGAAGEATDDGAAGEATDDGAAGEATDDGAAGEATDDGAAGEATDDGEAPEANEPLEPGEQETT